MRVFLFTPGNRPERLERALTIGADAVIADLEDSVAAHEHKSALGYVAEWALSRSESQKWVRVRSGADGLRDIECLANRPLAGFVLPKVRTIQDIESAASVLRIAVKLIPLIETPEAVLNVAEITSHQSVARVLLGELDLNADLGLSAKSPGWHAIRVSLVLASAANDIAPPIAPPSPRFDNRQALLESTQEFRDLGFTARACIHPHQVEPIRTGLRPEPESIAWALSVLNATTHGENAKRGPDGEMVDSASVRLATRILSLTDKSVD